MKHLEQVLNLVRKRRPTLDSVLKHSGDLSLEDYTKTFRYTVGDTVSPSEEVIRVITDYTETLLGKRVAKKVHKTLTASQDVLTADHFGPVNWTITMQGNLVYSLSKQADEVVPVLAFGNIPLNNINYTKGFVLARDVNVNLYPSSKSTMLVTVAPKVTKEMVLKAQEQASHFYQHKQITRKEKDAVITLLTMYEQFLDVESIQEQFTKINQVIWKALFAPSLRPRIPEMVFLEAETIVTKLLLQDLITPSSAVSHFFFDKRLRTSLLKELDTQAGCWNLQKLQQLMVNHWTGDRTERAQQRRAVMAGSGTIFFWGVDDKGRRIPLQLNAKQTHLEGLDDSGNPFSLPFTLESLIKALEGKTILPSLFTSFLTIALLRGFKCYGGFMQTDYLTNMKHGVIAALEVQARENPLYAQWAQTITRVPTANYSTGMTFLLARYGQNIFKSAGGVEIIAHGGLSQEDVQRIHKLTVTQANIAGALTVYPVVYRESERDTAVLQLTLEDVYNQLKENIVVIDLT